MKKTYRVDHPTIEEISIGDKFVTECGEIVTFTHWFDSNRLYPINTNRGENHSYTIKLRYYLDESDHDYNILCKVPSIKDKIDLL